MFYNLYFSWCCLFNSSNWGFLLFFFLFTPLSFQNFSKFLGRVIYVTLPMLLYKRTSVPRTKENLLSGDRQSANHSDGRNILAVVNKLCQKHIRWNSNMLMLQTLFDIPEQIQTWTSKPAQGSIELFICYFSHSLVQDMLSENYLLR